MTLAIIVLGIVAFESTRTTRLNWDPTLYSGHKIPYGLYAFKELLPDILPDVHGTRKPLRELMDTTSGTKNFLSISDSIGLTVLDVDNILQQASRGSSFFFAANYFSKRLLDTLSINNQVLGEQFNPVFYRDKFTFTIKDFFSSDTVHIKALNSLQPGDHSYPYRQGDVFSVFTSFDSTQTSILAVNSKNEPVALKTVLGKGSITLVALPHAFANIYMMHEENHRLAATLLSSLPETSTEWTEYYQMGAGVSTTPLRYVLSQPALKSALYIMLAALVLFVFFEAKRKQRAIPIIDPLPNDTLQFVSTVGNLYLESHDHKSIAEKRINFFLDYIRTHFFLTTHDLDTLFIEKLSRKSGLEKKHISHLVTMINWVGEQKNISDTALLKLSNAIDQFFTKIKHS